VSKCVGPPKTTLVDHFIACWVLFIDNSGPGCWQNVEDIRAQSPTMIPVFDFVKNKRSGSKELAVSEDCGVVRVL
jgi:hypothetical protein